MSRASLIVAHLLEAETEVDDPEAYVASRLDTWDLYPLQARVRDIPGGKRRKGEGYSDQWDFVYKDWLFTVSTYEDGTQLWDAFYKVPAFSWDSKAEQKRGWKFSGGGDLVKLRKGYNPAFYLAKLKKMADANPNVWKIRSVPKMPEP